MMMRIEYDTENTENNENTVNTMNIENTEKTMNTENTEKEDTKDTKNTKENTCPMWLVRKRWYPRRTIEARNCLRQVSSLYVVNSCFKPTSFGKNCYFLVLDVCIS